MLDKSKLDNNIIESDNAQERIKELLKQQEQGYIDCLYNLAFIPARLKATEEELNKTEDEETKKGLKANILKNEKEYEANNNWIKQYEEVIPYFKTLLK